MATNKLSQATIADWSSAMRRFDAIGRRLESLNLDADTLCWLTSIATLETRVQPHLVNSIGRAGLYQFATLAATCVASRYLRRYSDTELAKAAFNCEFSQQFRNASAMKWDNQATQACPKGDAFTREALLDPYAASLLALMHLELTFAACGRRDYHLAALAHHRGLSTLTPRWISNWENVWPEALPSGLSGADITYITNFSQISNFYVNVFSLQNRKLADPPTA